MIIIRIIGVKTMAKREYVWLMKNKATKRWESSAFRFTKKEATQMANSVKKQGWETKVKKLTKRQIETGRW